jgi:DNA modification methylase
MTIGEIMAEPKAYKAKLADKFKPDENNLNRHTQRGQRLVENSQRKRGFGRPGFAASDGTVLGGNLSIMEVAPDIGLGDGEVFVVETAGDIPIIHLRTDVESGSEHAALLAADDNHSALKSINYDPEVLLAEIERGIDFDGIFEVDEIKEILGELGTEEPPDPGPPDISKADELQEKWGTAVGQIWSLGPHRVACGDCTDPAAVEGVMGGERANLFLTDPPYGVSYADKNAFLNRVALGKRIQKRIENDHQSMDDMKVLWYQAAKNACEGGDQMMMMMMMIGDAGWKVRHELIWLKNNHVLGRSDYQYKHEPIFYGWKRDGTHKWYGGFQTSVLEFNKPTKSDLHPTTKPVELIEFLTKNSTQKNETVYDPFLGSGTTLMACENMGRLCRGIEISPPYVAVCLERYQQAFGIEPELIKTS